MADTGTAEYAARLEGQTVWWKVLLDVQAPYRWNLRRLEPGYTLDIGCGIGRNLANLDGVGIDPNSTCVKKAKERGLAAFEPTEFRADPESFDTLLFAHVLEHMDSGAATELVNRYLRFLKPGGQVIMITPQEAGYRSDSTHVEFLDLQALRRIAESLGLRPERSYSFPFPRWAGRLFKYNEFVLTARK